MYEMVMSVLEDGVSVQRVAARYGVSEKTVRRKIALYFDEGKIGFAHASRGRRALNRTPTHTEGRILRLYEKKYLGYNFTHFHQKVREVEGIRTSYATIYNILRSAGYKSPRARRKKRPEDMHPLRNRRAAFGELVQLDASQHRWFGSEVSHLHLAIDDATSHILGAHFEPQETLKGYFKLFKQVIEGYGVPEELFTDRRTVFCTKHTRSARLEDDHNTQFRLAASKLGVIKIHVSSVPQAKGRVERAFQTLQDRLINEMRTAKIASIDEANAFLPEFIADHNSRYALDISDMPNVFVEGPSGKELNIALSVVCERTVHAGSYITFKRKQYIAFKNRERVLIKGGTKVFVLRSLDDGLYLVHGNDIYPLICLSTMMLPDPADLKDRVYIPPKDHPWKEESYKTMLRHLGKAS